jgi:hypothetical protein
MFERFVPILVLCMVITSVQIADPSWGAGLVGARFSGEWGEMPVDRDKDGLFEELVIEVTVDVFEAGSYGVFGSIDDGLVHGSSGLIALPAGEHTIDVPFSGADIITMRPEGSLEITLQLYSSDPGSAVRTLDISTRDSYDPDGFERGSDYPGTSVTLESGEVLIRTPKVEIRLNTSRPLLSFMYPGEEDTRAALECLELIAFSDSDNNGYYSEGDDVRYSVDLSRDVDWNMEMDLRSGYRLDLRGIAPMSMEGSPEVKAWASVTITLDSSSIQPPGSFQKFDIAIELLQMIDADGLSVVQELRDESGGHTFAYTESGPASQMERTLSLEDPSGAVNGLFRWTDAILIGSSKADTPTKAHSQYSIGEGKAEVVFSYPLMNDTLFVYHDPTVGMDPDYAPDVVHRDPFMSNRPVGMGIGLIIGLALVLGAVAAARFRRR